MPRACAHLCTMHSAAPGRPVFMYKFGAKPLFSATPIAVGTHAISSHSCSSAMADASTQDDREKPNDVDGCCDDDAEAGGGGGTGGEARGGAGSRLSSTCWVRACKSYPGSFISP
jgi:hypothetical protein